MANDTIQSVYDALSPAKKDAADLIFGGIATNDSSVNERTVVGNSTLGAIYATFTPVEQALVAFIAGGIEPELSHDDLEFLHNILEHHGVKGMKWGVRRDRPPSARSIQRASQKQMRDTSRVKVKNNAANLHEAHLAAMKSTGHRVANGFLGDKTFWKRTGIIAAVAGAGVGASLAAPAVLPAGMLMHLGVVSVAGMHGGGTSAGLYAGAASIVAPAKVLAVGKIAATAIGMSITTATTGAAQGVNTVNNVGRAVTANYRINKSFEKLGQHMYAHQSLGSRKVQRLLKASGAKIKHADESFDDFLEHHGIKGMKWGVRRDNPSGSDVVIKTKGSRLVATGGKGHGPSADSVAAISALQKAKASSVHALNNDELKAINKRLELEKSFARLTEVPKNPAKEFVISHLKNEGGHLLRGKKGPIAAQIAVLLAAHSTKAAAKAAVGTGPLNLGRAGAGPVKIIKP